MKGESIWQITKKLTCFVPIVTKSLGKNTKGSYQTEIGYTFAKNVDVKIRQKRSNAMAEQLDKKTYIGIVRFTLQSMVELATEDKGYNLLADTLHYYETEIKKENILTADEFSQLCAEAGIK